MKIAEAYPSGWHATPEEVAACEKSYTGQFLKKMLGKR